MLYGIWNIFESKAEALLARNFREQGYACFLRAL